MIVRLLRQIFFRNPASVAYWLLAALAGRTLYYMLELHFMGQVGAPTGVWGIYYDDSYFAPVRNFIHEGSYTPDDRMPGLGIIYLPLALFFTPVKALNIFILAQVLVSALSVYVLAITARRAFNHNFFFYTVFYLYLISPFTAISDSSPASESFCTSLLIFSTYYFQKALDRNRFIFFFLSGTLLTWASFIRPAHFPLLIIFTVIGIVSLLKSRVKLLSYVFIYMAPFLITEGAWITRNYFRYHKFIPTLHSIYLASCKDTYRYPIWQLERAWGLEDWRIDWLTEKDSGNILKENVALPYVVYTSKYNADTMRAFKMFLNRATIRYAYKRGDETIYVDSVSNANRRIIEDRCRKYIHSLKQEKPFQYYILSRLHLITDYFKLSVFSNFEEPYMCTFGAITYYFTLFAGIAGIILMAGYCIRLERQSLYAFIPLYSVFIHPVIFRLAQNRYFVPSYPFLVVCAAYTLYLLYCKAIYNKSIRSRKQQ